MNIFGFNVPLWIVLSVVFGLIYILFSVLSAIRVRRLKSKRKDINVTNDI